ncbi:MAG: NAD-dependent epimerase/dehydratase family protein, partial [Bacilli bacterium]
MKILVLGGTRFFGKKAVEVFLERGHEVTIATRGNTPFSFSKPVEHIVLDRTNEFDVHNKLGNTTWDVVFDNICYNPFEMKILSDAIQKRCGKYVFTSSLAVYDEVGDVEEQNWDPLHHDYSLLPSTEWTYKSGKQQCESYLFQEKLFKNAVAVRFPVVFGADDYTGRFASYLNTLDLGCIEAEQPDVPMSLISSNAAATALLHLVENSIQGAIDVACIGTTTVRELVT